MMSKTAATRARSPLTEAGIASYSGVLAAYEITVTGTLPEGKTTANITYLIADTVTNTVVGTVTLPDCVEPKTAVSMTLKVANPSASFAIGTFEDGAFHPSSLLSVRNPISNLTHSGPVGPITSSSGILAAHEITVTGTLPEGKTTANVTYYIGDRVTNTIVGTVALPDAIEPKTPVLLTLKVAKPSASFAIGTFEDGAFHASSFLSVRNPTHSGAVGPAE